MIEQADFYVRLIGIGASLMLLALLVEGDIRSEIKVTLVGLIIGVCAYLINSSPLLEARGPIDVWVDLVSLSPPFWIWMFARRLFEREPPRWAVLSSVIGLVLAWFFGNFVDFLAVPAFYVIHAISLTLIVDLVRVALRDRSDDLIEKRRSIRLWLPILIAAQAGSILMFEMIVGMAISVPWVQLANGLLILLLTLFAGMSLMRTDPELLVETETAGHERDAQSPALDLSPSEAVLNEKLTSAMEDGAYREPGLTITALAETLGTPEHRLRALINGRLGYRNFSAFLNRHRIAEAKSMLEASEKVDLPILTIAMDLGYNSLPPFNRAFRSETGTSPSEYRKRAFENGTPEESDKDLISAENTDQN